MSTLQNSLYATTKKRLVAYEVFSEDTIELVASFAQKQAQYKTYQEFFDATNVPTPQLFVNQKGEGVPVVDIASRKKQKGTIVVHLPMANPLDANQLYHVATIVATHPDYRVIAFGNPSGEPFSYKEQNLTFWKRLGVRSLRNLQPLVSAEIDYLEQNKVVRAHHVGYSYGAHKALIEALFAKPEFIRSLILIDPVAHPRGLKQLAEDFKRTFRPLGNYVNRTNIQSYFDARKVAATTGHHKQALKRPINIAIGFMMARLDFIPTVRTVLAKQPGLRVTVVWGSKSELGNDAHITTSLDALSRENNKRVYALRLKDDTHALANDIHLHVAIIHEALRAETKGK